MLSNLRGGDEVTITGRLKWVRFKGEKSQMLIYARFTSYGRKSRTLA
jgi:hypothetical protein